MRRVAHLLLFILIVGGIGALADDGPPGMPAVYRLAVEVVGQGSVNLVPAGALYGDVYYYTSPDGSPITVDLTAIPDTDWFFSHWEIGTGIPPGSTTVVTDNPTSVVLSTGDPDWTVRAVFVQEIYYDVTVTAEPPEGGTVSGGGSYLAGSEVTVTATPDPCYEFVNWTEDGVEVSTEPEYVFTIDSDRDLVANFQLKQFTVTVSANPPEGGTVDGDGTFPCGSSVTVSAVANEGYQFLYWTENTSVVSYTPTYTFTLTANRNLVAHFQAVVPGITREYLAGWNMVSIPLDPDSVDFSGIPAPVLYHWNPATGTYQELVDPTAMEPCLGYWLYVPPAGTTASVVGSEVLYDVTIPTSTPGWQMISTPWPFQVGDLRFQVGGEVKSWTEASAAGWVVPILFTWDPSGSTYQVIEGTEGFLDPWQGYWLRTLVADMTILLLYDYAGPPSPPASGGTTPSALHIEALPPPPPLAPAVLQEFDVVNEPNPVQDVHTTVFKVLGPLSTQVEAMRVMIYDLAGKLVWEGEVAGAELAWHTEDLTGAYLANGVYLYKVMVKFGDIWITSQVKKLAVYR